ncbi:uncharacterized protein V1518DRAFT_412169 [Limtongia smithiae]|uniref:uncharacterized protein n=1 Tax=Limtongia smithiae TaxID=1125753 RepID=UPI0034CD431C
MSETPPDVVESASLTSLHRPPFVVVEVHRKSSSSPPLLPEQEVTLQRSEGIVTREMFSTYQQGYFEDIESHERLAVRINQFRCEDDVEEVVHLPQRQLAGSRLQRKQLQKENNLPNQQPKSATTRKMLKLSAFAPYGRPLSALQKRNPRSITFRASAVIKQAQTMPSALLCNRANSQDSLAPESTTPNSNAAALSGNEADAWNSATLKRGRNDIACRIKLSRLLKPEKAVKRMRRLRLCFPKELQNTSISDTDTDNELEVFDESLRLFTASCRGVDGGIMDIDHISERTSMHELFWMRTWNVWNTRESINTAAEARRKISIVNISSSPTAPASVNADSTLSDITTMRYCVIDSEISDSEDEESHPVDVNIAFLVGDVADTQYFEPTSSPLQPLASSPISPSPPLSPLESGTSPSRPAIWQLGYSPTRLESRIMSSSVRGMATSGTSSLPRSSKQKSRVSASQKKTSNASKISPNRATSRTEPPAVRKRRRELSKLSKGEMELLLQEVGSQLTRRISPSPTRKAQTSGHASPTPARSPQLCTSTLSSPSLKRKTQWGTRAVLSPLPNRRTKSSPRASRPPSPTTGIQWSTRTPPLPANKSKTMTSTTPATTRKAEVDPESVTTPAIRRKIHSNLVMHLRTSTLLGARRWWQKILTYEPIVLEDFAHYLVSEGLVAGGGTGASEVDAGTLAFVKDWCDAEGVCFTTAEARDTRAKKQKSTRRKNKAATT